MGEKKKKESALVTATGGPQTQMRPVSPAVTVSQAAAEEHIGAASERRAARGRDRLRSAADGGGDLLGSRVGSRHRRLKSAVTSEKRLRGLSPICTFPLKAQRCEPFTPRVSPISFLAY